jgi:hypothetical protein
MSATLKVTHKAIGVEVRRDPYDIEVDGKSIGSVEMNQTFEAAIDPGTHSLQVRCGKDSSAVKLFDAGDDQVVSYRATGKRFLPLFLASLVDPKLALVLIRE